MGTMLDCTRWSRKGLPIERCSSVRKVCGGSYNIDASWTVVETDNGYPNRIAVVRCSVVTVRIAVGSSNGEGRNLAVVRDNDGLGGIVVVSSNNDPGRDDGESNMVAAVILKWLPS